MDPQPRKKRTAQLKKKDKGPQIYSKKSVRIQNSCTKSTLKNTDTVSSPNNDHGSIHCFRH
jgi:hypothetical protein